jgi:hypothetical protein
MPEAVEVTLARIDGRVETLSQVTTHRVERLEAQLSTLTADVSDLVNWRSRVIGIAVGIGAASGIISGLVVSAFGG